jgi:alkanesulfonate monooxygenase SsuD/methylene tetrahydromethanopterin reductase-like flavin-dependent oxidoreductase (luciferase family)
LSKGRVSYVIGIGYREEEFAAFGVDRRGRGQLVEQRIELLRRLWTGEPAAFDGRAARVTPLPYTNGGPLLGYGGGSPAAARRAGRLGMYFFADSFDRELETIYRAAAEEAGTKARGCVFQPEGVPTTVFVAEDPDRAWSEIGEYILMDAVGYERWNVQRGETITTSRATTVEELKAERGVYQILTPDETRALVARGALISLQPLVGGIPADIAWPYLEAAAAVAG